MGAPLQQRQAGPNDMDGEAGPPPVVVNQAFAQYVPAENAQI